MPLVHFWTRSNLFPVLAEKNRFFRTSPLIMKRRTSETLFYRNVTFYYYDR